MKEIMEIILEGALSYKWYVTIFGSKMIATHSVFDFNSRSKGF